MRLSMSEFVLSYRDTVRKGLGRRSEPRPLPPSIMPRVPTSCEDSDGQWRQTAAYTRALSLTANAVERRYLWRKCYSLI